MTNDAPRPGSDDRRSVCRYAVMQPHAWLGWWEDEQFHSTPAEVLDISLRGCRMSVEQLPQAKATVWFCPTETSTSPGRDPAAISTPDDWIEAKLVESRKRLFGPRVVRVAFRKAFPYEVFKAVVYGRERVGGTRSPLWAPKGVGSEGQDWW